jgi:hypothetical protein
VKNRSFSVVMPVRSEYGMLRDSLRACYRICPDEILLCFDEPPHAATMREARRIIRGEGWEDSTRIITVPRNIEYHHHQAWVRREGFRQAKNDRILTVDADIVVNGNVAIALSLVGADNVGMVSCLTLHTFRGFLGPWRVIAHSVANRLYPPGLTGLYALWRPYWLDSEDDGIKEIEDPHSASALEGMVLVGEDTYLRNCMKRKHKCVHLPAIGGRCLRDDCNDNPHVQFELGRYYFEEKLAAKRVLLRSVVFARPHIMAGYAYQGMLKRKSFVSALR